MIFQFDKDKFGQKWIAYFDLLGFGKFVDQNSIERVMELYFQCLKALHERALIYELKVIWFSDSFIIYSKDDCPGLIEAVSEMFLDALIKNEIPVRGAISFGYFYADQKQNIFVGKALVEAHKFGEGQKWIGLVYCPSAEEKMTEMLLLPPLDPWWVKCDVLIKDNPANLYSYVIGNSLQQIRVHEIVATLINMKEKLTDKPIRSKYKRTIAFLQHWIDNEYKELIEGSSN